MAATLAPVAHRIAIATHALLALWLLGNGVAHEIGVALAGLRGTLKNPADFEALLGVGAGLLVAGSVVAWSLARLFRGGETGPAFAALAVLGVVVLAIAARYGWMFLGGTTAVALLDAVALAAYALRR